MSINYRPLIFHDPGYDNLSVDAKQDHSLYRIAEKTGADPSNLRGDPENPDSLSIREIEGLMHEAGIFEPEDSSRLQKVRNKLSV